MAVSYADKLTVYHGSFWEEPEDGDTWDDTMFATPDPDYNEDGVVYFSRAVEVAEQFSKWRDASPEGKVYVVLRGSLELKSPFVFEGGHEIEIGGEWHDWPMEREDLYRELQAAGHDAFVVPDNYAPGHDDIAVLDSGAFSPEDVKLKIDGRWSDWMPFDDAVGLLEAARLERDAAGVTP
jgi:hypothetical protein